MVKGVNTIICEVTDMDRAVQFYRDVLALTPEMVTPYWSSFCVGGTRIGLHPPMKGWSAGARGGWILGLEVEDLVAFRRLLEENGHMVGEYHDTPSGAIIDFSDPDGNRLQAIELGSKAASLQA